MLFTWLAGFMFNIVLVFRMGDPAELLASTQPVALLFFNALGPAGGVFFTVCAFIILQFVCFTACQSLARTIFAFSRDRLLPFSHVWTKVNIRTGTPLYAVWVSIFFCICINLIGLGSYIAIAGVFNVTAIALDWSYIIPIVCKLAFGKFEPGPWHLGKFSTAVNVWACVWTLFVSIIFILPTILPVQGDNMNYAIVFLGAILVFSAVFWYATGKNYYTGPLTETELMEEESIKDSSSGDGSETKESKEYK